MGMMCACVAPKVCAGLSNPIQDEAQGDLPGTGCPPLPLPNDVDTAVAGSELCLQDVWCLWRALKEKWGEPDKAVDA